MKLQTKLTLFLPSKRVQRRHYTLHRCASSFASIDDIASEMHRRGWVDRGPVKSRTPPTFKKCFGCGARDKTKKNFARNQWLREEPRCRSCTTTSVDLEFDRVMVRREVARKAALAAFVPPQPRAIVQGVVLPLPKPDKLGIHPELVTEEPAAAPAELAAAPKGKQPPKGKKKFGTPSSRATAAALQQQQQQYSSSNSNSSAAATALQQQQQARKEPPALSARESRRRFNRLRRRFNRMIDKDAQRCALEKLGRRLSPSELEDLHAGRCLPPELEVLREM